MIGFGFELAESVVSSDARMMSAMRLLSGAHAYSSMPSFSSVTRCASPPRRSSSQSCDPLPPSRDERNDRYFPSGLQRGDVSASGDDVNWITCVPSQLAIQTSVFDLSFAESRLVTV